MIKKTLAAIALTAIAVSAQAAVQFQQQGFDNVNTLAAQGWLRINAGTPGGSTGAWFQGDQNIFGAKSGAANSYIAANYDNAPAGGTIDSWLITPVFNTDKNGSVSFWLRAEDASAFGFTDQIQVGFSNGGSALGDFTMGAVFTAPTDGWTQYTFFYNTGAAGSTGRFAIRYTGAADTSDYVGVDSLQVNVPEPASALLFAAGMLGLGAMRRRQRG